MASYTPNHNATDKPKMETGDTPPQKSPVTSDLAIDNRTTTRPVASPQAVNENDIVTVDLHNPTRGQRVIYDGIKDSMRQIVINPGATKKNVRLHKSIERELRDRNRLKKDSDLVASESEEA